MAEATSPNILAQLRQKRSLAELVAWMNAQPRRPGFDGYKYHHRQVRKMLEEQGVALYQRDSRCKVWFRVDDLKQYAPILAKAFLATPAAAARAE